MIRKPENWQPYLRQILVGSPRLNASQQQQKKTTHLLLRLIVLRLRRGVADDCQRLVSHFLEGLEAIGLIEKILLGESGIDGPAAS